MIMSLFTACAQESDVPDGYQLIAREGDEFRLYVPTQGWSSNVWSGTTGAIFSLEQNATVNVYKADDAGEMTIDEYWSFCNEKYASELEEYSFSGKSENTVLGGQPAKKYVFSAKMTAVDGEEAKTSVFKFLTVLCRYDGNMYSFVYAAPEEYYDMHIEDVEGDENGVGMIPYFKFDKPYKADEDKKYSDVDAPEGMKIISTDELPYRFFVPESWIVNDSKNNGAGFCAATASETDSSNVSLQMYMTSDESMTVEDYFASLEKRYKEIFASYALDSMESIKMDGSDAKKYVYTITVGGVKYKQMQAIVVRGAVFYTLTYTALPENFDSHTDEVNKMIENFDIR